MKDLLILDKSYLYKITIIALVLFIPSNVFSDDLNNCSSLIDSNSDNISEMFQIMNTDFTENTHIGHVDFSYCNLIGVNLTNVNIINANFEGADLSGANLYSANLQNANFNNAILYGTNLKSTSLINASFENSILNGSTFRDADLENVNFTNAVLRNV